MSPLDFAAIIRSHDGVDAFNEASRLAMAADSDGRVNVVVTDGPHIVALAYATDDAPVELAVHPAHRRHGHGSALLARLIESGETDFWAHGDSTAARKLAATAHLTPTRTLLRLHRSLAGSSLPASGKHVDIRPFRPHDIDGLLAINARAFAHHPEQGAMDRADFESRTSASWFDPAGLFVAEHGDNIVGFHWTKVEHGVGEVYVLAVDPAHEGSGLGVALLNHGLRHLAEAGVDGVELYVEGDHARAVALYVQAGFREISRDVLYVSTLPAAAGPDRS